MREIQKAKSKMMFKCPAIPQKSEHVNNLQAGNRRAMPAMAYCGGRTWPLIEQVGNCPTAPIV